MSSDSPTPPQGNAKAPINVFWILHRKDGYDLCFKFPRSEEDMKFLCAFDQTKVVEYKYAKELEAEIERLNKVILREVSENDEIGAEYTYVRALRDENKSLTEKLAVAEAMFEKIDNTSDCKFALEIVDEALASIRGKKNG